MAGRRQPASVIAALGFGRIALRSIRTDWLVRRPFPHQPQLPDCSVPDFRNAKRSTSGKLIFSTNAEQKVRQFLKNLRNRLQYEQNISVDASTTMWHMRAARQAIRE
jgi:hypothetical protein